MEPAKRFDEKARAWDANPLRIEISQAFTPCIVRSVPLPADMTVLDFGCGTGLVGMQFQPIAKSVIMVDNSQGMLDVLRGKIERHGATNMEVLLGDIHELDLAGREIDLACAMMVLHHVPDVERLLRRFHQILKPGGCLCVGDLEPEDGSFHEDGVKVHHGFDAINLKRIAEESDFEVTVMRRMHVLKKPDRRGLIREYPLFLMVAVNR